MALKTDITKIKKMLSGSPSRSEIGERNPAGMQSYLYNAFNGMESTYGPTGLHKQSLATAKELLKTVKARVRKMNETHISEIEDALKAAGAPYINGQGMNN
jgi:hypothetical protein